MNVELIYALAVMTVMLMVSILWPSLRGAPWVPTTMRGVYKMLDMAGVEPNDVVYDLGCGDGRMIITVARKYGAQAVGIEIDPLRYLWCQILITILGLRGQVRIIFGDFFTQDLSEADVVTCYLLQTTNEKLQNKLLHELHPSARVVSHDYTFTRLREVRRDSKDRIYLYRKA